MLILLEFRKVWYNNQQYFGDTYSVLQYYVSTLKFSKELKY